MTNWEKVLLMQEWFKENRSKFEKSFQLNAWTKVLNVDNYIDTQLETIEYYAREKTYGDIFKESYLRLYELKRYHECQNKKD